MLRISPITKTRLKTVLYRGYLKPSVLLQITLLCIWWVWNVCRVKASSSAMCPECQKKLVNPTVCNKQEKLEYNYDCPVCFNVRKCREEKETATPQNTCDRLQSSELEFFLLWQMFTSNIPHLSHVFQLSSTFRMLILSERSFMCLFNSAISRVDLLLSRSSVCSGSSPLCVCGGGHGDCYPAPRTVNLQPQSRLQVKGSNSLVCWSIEGGASTGSKVLPLLLCSCIYLKYEKGEMCVAHHIHYPCVQLSNINHGLFFLTS